MNKKFIAIVIATIMGIGIASAQVRSGADYEEIWKGEYQITNKLVPDGIWVINITVLSAVEIRFRIQDWYCKIPGACIINMQTKGDEFKKIKMNSCGMALGCVETKDNKIIRIFYDKIFISNNNIW